MEEPRTDNDSRVNYAIRKVLADYGDRVSVDAALRTVLKFGENAAVGTSLTEITTLPSGIETSPGSTSANTVTAVVSTSASDTGTIEYEGFYFDGTDLVFAAAVEVTLTGQTPVTLPTAVARLTRAKSTSAASMVGDVAFYEGGGVSAGSPDDDDQVHLILQAGQAQSQKCATSVAAADYWLMSGLTVSVLEKTTASAQLRVEYKAAGGAIWYPLTQYFCVSNASGTVAVEFAQLKIVPKNSDVRMVSIASGAGVNVAAGMFGWLAAVQG